MPGLEGQPGSQVPRLLPMTGSGVLADSQRRKGSWSCSQGPGALWEWGRGSGSGEEGMGTLICYCLKGLQTKSWPRMGRLP